MSSGRLIVAFFLYGLTIYISQLVLNSLSPSARFEMLISWASVPLQILVFPWLSSLETMNMTEGEWVKAPTFVGLVIVLTGYSLFIFILANLLKRILRLWLE